MPHSAYASPQALLVWHELNQTTVRAEPVEAQEFAHISTKPLVLSNVEESWRTASAQRTAHSAQRTAHSAQRTAHSAQRTAHSIRRGRSPAKVPAFPKFLYRRIPCARYFRVPVFYRFIPAFSLSEAGRFVVPLPGFIHLTSMGNQNGCNQNFNH